MSTLGFGQSMREGDFRVRASSSFSDKFGDRGVRKGGVALSQIFAQNFAQNCFFVLHFDVTPSATNAVAVE